MAALIRRISSSSSSSISIIGAHFPLSNPKVPNSLTSSLVCRRGIASKLFVGGLSFYTTEKTLAEAFSQYGQVIDATIVHDLVSERSKGFGFVTYASEDEADTALAEMNGKGRVIIVDHAKPKGNFRTVMPIARGPPEGI